MALPPCRMPKHDSPQELMLIRGPFVDCCRQALPLIEIGVDVCRQYGMYGPPPCCKRKVKMTVWSAQMYPVFDGAEALDLDGMRCALVLTTFQASEGFSV